MFFILFSILFFLALWARSLIAFVMISVTGLFNLLMSVISEFSNALVIVFRTFWWVFRILPCFHCCCFYHARSFLLGFYAYAHWCGQYPMIAAYRYFNTVTSLTVDFFFSTMIISIFLFCRSSLSKSIFYWVYWERNCSSAINCSARGSLSEFFLVGLDFQARIYRAIFQSSPTFHLSSHLNLYTVC